MNKNIKMTDFVDRDLTSEYNVEKNCALQKYLEISSRQETLQLL